MFDTLSSNIQQVATLITSLTVVGSALMWIYNKSVSQPREKKRKQEADERERNRLEHERKQQAILTEALKPINEFIHESKSDRQALNKVAFENTEKLKEHDSRISSIDDRLIIVETKQEFNGRSIQYTEVYKGDEQ
ncbi:hypothetical protein ACF3NG_06725 [Aerococcaceae bacterium WGS1372]